MPKMLVPVDTQTTQIVGPGTFQFSAARPDTLGATEYTLVSLVVDVSSSVGSFRGDLQDMLKNVIDACGKTSRIDNLMLRLTTFNDKLDEVHGFVPLNKINANDYPDLNTSGMTALYDATFEAVSATTQYAETLTDQDYDVNAIVFVVTDGADNRSTTRPADIAKVMKTARKDEIMDSVQTVLIGINDYDCQDYLNDFRVEADIDEFISVGDASIENLSKLGRFISQSVSSTSNALGSGGPSTLIF